MTPERTRPDATERWRLFVALPLSPEAAHAVARTLAPYRDAHPDARWLRPEQSHVTVRFLGGVDPIAVPVIADAVAATADRARPFQLVTDRAAGDLRGRGGSRVGVAWLTLARGVEEVRALCGTLDPMLPLNALASPHLRRPPDAHVTVARRASAALIEALRAQALGSTRMSWTADRVVLFRSHTGTRAGSSYEPLAEATITDHTGP